MSNNYIDKCFACGYIYEQGFDKNKEWNVLKGDIPFLKIRNHNLRHNIKEVRLIACPKCGTLKIDNLEHLLDD